MTATPDANRPTASQERAFARAHPELATLATVQIREAMAIEHRLRMLAEDQLARANAVARWAAEHGVPMLPLDAPLDLPPSLS